MIEIETFDFIFFTWFTQEYQPLPSAPACVKPSSLTPSRKWYCGVSSTTWDSPRLCMDWSFYRRQRQRGRSTGTCVAWWRKCSAGWMVWSDSCRPWRRWNRSGLTSLMMCVKESYSRVLPSSMTSTYKRYIVSFLLDWTVAFLRCKP